jgi:hypothetical protein
MGLTNPKTGFGQSNAETARAPAFVPSDAAMGSAGLSVAELERLLDSVLASLECDGLQGSTLPAQAASSHEPKWPAAYRLGFILGSSTILWAAIIFAAVGPI